MVQLKFTQTKAPDFSGVSTMLARAGIAQQRAFDSVGGLLSSYSEGRQEKVDNEVFSEIAGMNEEQLHGYFEKNGLKGRQISESFRQRLGKRFSQLATTAETLSGTGRAEAVEARKQYGFDQTNAAIAADRALKGSFAAAEQERYNKGLGATPPVGEDVAAPPGTPGSEPKTPASAAIEAAAVAPGGGVETVTTALPDYTPSTPTEASFMGAVGTGFTGADGTVVPGVKNPFALSVIAAYGQHESGFDPKNVSREWADGENNAGGTMSWNGPRLKAMQKFVGDDKSPEAQAAFFLQEDPKLMRDLEASTSVEEANSIMAAAWRFKGWKNTGPGTEFAGRLATAQGIYGNGPAPVAGPTGGPVTSTPLDPIAVAAAPPAERVTAAPIGPQGPEGYRLTTPGSENVASGFATALPTLTDPEATSGGVLPTGPTGVPAPGGSPLPAKAAATVPAPVVPEAAPEAPEATSAAATIAASTPAPVATPAMDKFRADVLADDTIGSREASKLFAEMDEFEEAGVAKRKSKRAEKVRGQIADLVMKNAADPENHDRRSMVLDTIRMAQEAGLTSEEVMQAAQFASDAADGSLKDLLIPKVTDNVMTDAIIATAVKAGNTRINSMPQHVLFSLASDFAQAESVTAGIVENLNLLDDGEVSSEYPFGLDWWGEDGRDMNIMTDYIESIASEAGVTPAIAAAAMVKNFIRDPAWQNSVHSRFPRAKILTYLEANMGEEAVARYQSAVLTEKARTQEFAKERLTLGIKQGTFNKMEAGPKKDALGAEIATLVDALSTGSTVKEGEAALKEYIGPNGMNVSDYLLRAIENGDTERQKEGIHRVVKTIMEDKKLSPTARVLLLSALKM